MKITVKVEGLSELDKALGQLTKSAAKGVLRRVGRKALQPTDKAWRAKAPVLSGTLAQSGGVGSNLSRSLRRQVERSATVEVYAGPGTNPQAIQQEFGNVNQPAQPFLRPAWDETKHEALDIVKTELGGEIDKAARRLAKKRAKAGG